MVASAGLPPLHDIDDLERSLQRHWELETLGVYADSLIAIGDPRGELIAMDIAIANAIANANANANANGDASEDLRERRQRVADAWLAKNAPSNVIADMQFGLVEDFTLNNGEDAARVHETEAGRFLRTVNISAEASELPTILANFSMRPLLWLRRLSISQRGVGPLNRAVSEAFAAQAPNLEELILHGNSVMVSPGHPHVTTLRLGGRNALVIGRESMPNVQTIDLAFESSNRP